MDANEAKGWAIALMSIATPAAIAIWRLIQRKDEMRLHDITNEEAIYKRILEQLREADADREILQTRLNDCITNSLEKERHYITECARLSGLAKDARQHVEFLRDKLKENNIPYSLLPWNESIEIKQPRNADNGRDTKVSQ